jgi:proton glutamate symport protein
MQECYQRTVWVAAVLICFADAARDARNSPMSQAKTDLGLTVSAACLLLAGIATAVAEHRAGAADSGAVPIGAVIMRWAAILLMAVYALKKRTLTPWIFVAMVAGSELGFDAPKVAVEFRILSDIFLKLIKTIVAPLILATLITGIAGHGDLKGVGRMAWKSLVYFEVVTTLALVIGLLAINWTQAGVGLNVAGAVHASAPAPPVTSWQELVLHVFPENIAKSIAEGQILQVAVFAVLFGISLAALPEAKRAPVLRLAEGVSEAMFKFTNIVMYLAPLAVFAALAYTAGSCARCRSRLRSPSPPAPARPRCPGRWS